MDPMLMGVLFALAVLAAMAMLVHAGRRRGRADGDASAWSGDGDSGSDGACDAGGGCDGGGDGGD